MQRRTAIRIIALGALAPTIDAAAARHCAMPAGAAWTPGNYTLQFFTPAENDMVDQLTEMIIPADSHSPGAHAAQVSLFADLMIATSDEGAKAQWREGLGLFREAAAKSSLAEALAQAAAHEGQPTTALERFFPTLKQMTINGYYTSQIGIDKDIEYIGNTYLECFPGYPPLD